MSDKNNNFDEQVMDIGLARIDTGKIVRPFSEVLEEIAPQGTPIKLTEIEGQDVVIYAARPFVGEYGPAFFVILGDGVTGELFNVIVGQKIIVPKLAAVVKAGSLPVSCRFVQHEGGQGDFYWDVE